MARTRPPRATRRTGTADPPIHAEIGRGRCTSDVYTIRPDGTDLERVATTGFEEWSVTWSPDGTRLMVGAANDGDNDLYVIDRDGSGAERITDSPGADGLASWSPDAMRTVFASDRAGKRSLYTAAADGSDVQPLADGLMATWSPDGDTIAYVAARPGEGVDLWLIDPDGSSRRPLVEGEGDELWPSWSPDGSTIAFTVDGQLAVVSVKDSAVTALDLGHEVVGDSRMEFTSWGVTRRIAFVVGSSIWTVHPDGSDPVQVEEATGRILTPAWSPDGQVLAFIGSRWEQ